MIDSNAPQAAAGQPALNAAALAAALALVALACASPAYAGGPNANTSSGGVVTIDQAKAAAGGVTSGDTAGFPITISQSGSYRLVSNLLLPDVNTTAIVVTAPNVTLDLGGFAIVGPVVCAGNPIVCNGSGSGDGIVLQGAAPSMRTALTVMNGSVRGMGRYGLVTPYNTGAVRIERMTVVQNGAYGIWLASGGVVTDSQISYNGHHGVAGDMVQLVNNVIRGNAGTGASLNHASVGLHNLIQFNGINVASGGMKNLGPNWCDLALCP